MLPQIRGVGAGFIGLAMGGDGLAVAGDVRQGGVWSSIKSYRKPGRQLFRSPGGSGRARSIGLA